MDEKRGEVRRRQLKAARARFNHGNSAVPCTLRDISEHGCRLGLDGTQTMVIPNRFDLIIEIDGIEVECEVVWRTRSSIGARFISPPRKGKAVRDQVIHELSSHSQRRK